MVMKLTLQTTYLGEICQNVFYYDVSGVDPSTADLLVVFATDVIPDIQNIVSSAVSFVNLDAINLDDPTDFSNVAIVGTPGARPTDPSPPFLAWGYTYNRTSRVVRSGAKRFVGIAEGDMDEGIAVTGILAALDALGAQLSTSLVGPIGGVYEPIIYGDVTPTRLVPIAVPVSSVTYTRITSQNSRKFS